MAVEKASGYVHTCDKGPDKGEHSAWRENEDDGWFICHECIGVLFCPWCGEKLPEAKGE